MHESSPDCRFRFTAVFPHRNLKESTIIKGPIPAFLSSFIFFCSFLSLTSCASTVSIDRWPKADAAHLQTLDGTVALLTIDGKFPALDGGGIFNSNEMDMVSAFDISLSPGPHTFDLYLNGSDHVVSIGFEHEAGTAYVLRSVDGTVEVHAGKVTEGGAIPMTMKKLPFYSAPTDGNCARLQFRDDVSGGWYVGVKRIDDMYPADLKTFLIQYRYNSLWDGAMNTALLPGKHTVYCFASKSGGGRASYLNTIAAIEFEFEAGKFYGFAVKTDEKGLYAEIGIVELEKSLF